MRLVDSLLDLLMRPRVRRVLRWSFVVTLPLAALLVSLRGVDTVLALFALEFAVFMAVIAFAARVGGERGRLILDFVMHPTGRRVLRSEAVVLLTLPRALLRSVSRSRRDDEYPYAKGDAELPLALAFIPAIVAEMTALHLLLPAPGWLKIALLAASAYGLLWLLGWAVGLHTYPHRIRDDVLELRLGPLYRAAVPLESIAAVRRERERDGSRTRLDVTGDAAAARIGGRVDLHLSLDRPATIERPFGAPRAVTSIAFAADDPAGLAARLEVGAAPTTSTPPIPGGTSCTALARS